jgi:hypothetical protein
MQKEGGYVMQYTAKAFARDLTNSSQTVCDSEPLQQFHTPTISDVHLWPFGRVRVPFSKHARDSVSRQLQCRNQSRWSSTDHEDGSLMLNSLVRLDRVRKGM